MGEIAKMKTKKKTAVETPLEVCTRMIEEKRGAYVEAMRQLGQSADPAELASVVSKFRSFYAFGARVANITGRNAHLPRWSDLHERLTDRQRRALIGLKSSGTLPPGAPLVEPELEALARLEAATPKRGPRIFEDGEAAYRKYLAAKGISEADVDDEGYKSVTGLDKYSPPDDPNHEHYKFSWEE